MTKRILYILVGSALILASCKKEADIVEPLNNNANTTMEDLNVSSNFNYETFRDVELTLIAYAQGVVEISSQEGTIFLRAYLSKKEPYSTKLTVPTYLGAIQLRFKGSVVDIELGEQPINYVFKY